MQGDKRAASAGTPYPMQATTATNALAGIVRVTSTAPLVDCVITLGGTWRARRSGFNTTQVVAVLRYCSELVPHKGTGETWTALCRLRVPPGVRPLSRTPLT